jgi:site-specific recombinase XerD
MSTIAPDIEAYLGEHLVRQRDASPHTCDSYAYSFQLLFEFAANTLKVSPSRLTLEQLDTSLVSAFLEHLEQVRGNSPETRNVRLAAIRSFYRFLEYRHPEALDQIRRVLAIPFKRTDSPLVPYTREGIRDRAMLQVAVCAGLRVSELIGLTVDNISLPAMTIRVHGKGRRERVIPLWKVTATALRAWLAIRGTNSVPEAFINARAKPMSRWGFAYVLKRHVQEAKHRCPSLSSKQISPHVLRHTCAVIVLQATGDIRKVSLWLGHANQETTEIYTRIDPTEKLEAVNAIVPPHLRKGTFQPPDRLIAWLKNHTYGDPIRAAEP